MASRDFFIPGLLAASGLFNRAETTRQTQTQGITESPAAANMRARLLAEYESLLNGNDGVNGLVASNLSDINRARDIQKQQMLESLAVRGITGPAANAAIENIENQRVSDIVKAQQGGNLQSLQMRQALLNQEGSFANSAPQTTTSTSAVTTPGNRVGQAFSNVSEYLANLYGRQYARNNPGAGNAPNLPFPAGAARTGQAPNLPQLPNIPFKQIGRGLKKVFSAIF